MGVDLSVDVGVGFIIDPDAFMNYRKTVPDEENYADQELLDDIVEGIPDFRHGTGGSYYDSGESNQSWIAISRLTQHYGGHDIPGGVIGLNKPTITLAEREGLNAIAKKLGQPEPIIGQFMSVLWH